MSCTALAIRPVSRPLSPFGLRADLGAITGVLMEMEGGHAADRRLDAAIYAALGWDVRTPPGGTPRRRIRWWCRSPLQQAWMPLPSPTGDLAAARRLVPTGWSWGVGIRRAQPFGWCEEGVLRPGHCLPLHFEQTRLTPERALTAAALFAHRGMIMEETGHG